MSQVQVTLTFANAALAAAFMAAYAQSAGAAGNAQPSAAPAASTAPTAVAAPVAAPVLSAPISTAPDFDRDVLPAVQKLHGSNPAKFGALMQHYGFADVNALKAASDKWAEIVGHCNS